MDTSEWKQVLEAEFPRLSSEGFETVGQESERYNCIAYAAGNTTEWWWPDGVNHWPSWATVDDKMESLKEVFAGLDYEQCGDSGLEAGYEKVALYEMHGGFKHAALQTPDGRWRSKMGRGPLIEHLSPESLAGGSYGNPTIRMRRQVPEDSPG